MPDIIWVYCSPISESHGAFVKLGFQTVCREFLIYCADIIIPDQCGLAASQPTGYRLMCICLGNPLSHTIR